MGVRHLIVAAALLPMLAPAVVLGSPPAPPHTGAATHAARVPQTMTWKVGSVERQALVFAPAATPGMLAAKHPLIFGFHGHGGTMQGSAQQMHFETLWPLAVVVYPQGLNGASPIDPQGLHSGWQQVAGDEGGRDLAFFDVMLAAMRQAYAIDDARVYTAGFSSGATFSYLLWSTRAPQLAALGICAGHFAAPTAPGAARAVVHIAGRTDTTVVFTDQESAIATDRQADSAMAAGHPCGQHCTLYPSTTQTPVETVIHGGGHVFPPWASATIVKFFQAHEKP